MDKITPEKRSRIMKQVHSKNTQPEVIIRKFLFAQGFRYRVHQKDLPGKPDIVFSKKKKVIFINGCFWHGHGCRKNLNPKSNTIYWNEKIKTNIIRDANSIKELNEMGWESMVVWECELKNMEVLEKQIIHFLR